MPAREQRNDERRNFRENNQDYAQNLRREYVFLFNGGRHRRVFFRIPDFRNGLAAHFMRRADTLTVAVFFPLMLIALWEEVGGGIAFFLGFFVSLTNQILVNDPLYLPTYVAYQYVRFENYIVFLQIMTGEFITERMRLAMHLLRKYIDVLEWLSLYLLTLHISFTVDCLLNVVSGNPFAYSARNSLIYGSINLQLLIWMTTHMVPPRLWRVAIIVASMVQPSITHLLSLLFVGGTERKWSDLKFMASYVNLTCSIIVSIRLVVVALVAFEECYALLPDNVQWHERVRFPRSLNNGWFMVLRMWNYFKQILNVLRRGRYN